MVPNDDAANDDFDALRTMTQQSGSSDTEAVWIAHAKRGSVDAFERLYRLYVRQVFGVCRRLLDSNEDAEDMTQRVFLQAWKRLEGFRGDSGLGTWLRRIAVNLIIDQRRAGWREQLESLGDEKDQLPSPRERSPGKVVDLERALGMLARGPRQVLVLHDVEGYTHAEVAALLGVTVGTTKTQLFRARKALREWLE